MKTKEIFSLKLAVYLRRRGFKIIKTGVNPKKPEFDTWFFNNTPELKNAIDDYMDNIYQSN